MVIKRVKPGDVRIIKRFALFPITIEYETRWLETVYILQFRKYSCYLFESEYWENSCFTDETEYKKKRGQTMNAKKARLNRQIDRSRQFVRYEAWKSIEPPRFRFFKYRKWKKLGVKLGYY